MQSTSISSPRRFLLVLVPVMMVIIISREWASYEMMQITMMMLIKKAKGESESFRVIQSARHRQVYHLWNALLPILRAGAHFGIWIIYHKIKHQEQQQQQQ